MDDSIVWSKELGWYAHKLPYPSNIGSPQIRAENITPWKTDGVGRVNKHAEAKFMELRREWEALMEELHWNEIIYNATFGFQPVIGHEYYLYKTEKEYTLSIISPAEWGERRGLEPVGTFRLRSDKIWEMVNNLT
jgi:hypothetical protein